MNPTIAPTAECAPAAKPAATSIAGARVILFAAAIFIALLILYTRNNTQPFRYHPDETSKIEQVLTGQRNFFHPTMLLDATSLAVRLFRVPQEMQPTVQAGRWVSAAFAAGCVVAMALAAYLEGGFLAMAAVALVVGLCPFLATNAHYLKEDTSLMFGLGLFVLGTRLVLRKSQSSLGRWSSLVLLAIACAVAASGKYVGALSIPLAFIVVLLGSRRKWADWIARPLVFLIVVTLAMSLLNIHAIQQWNDSWETFTEAAHQPIEGQVGGAMLRAPTGYFFWAAWNVTPAIVFLACGAALIALVIFRRRHLWDWLVAALPILVFAMLCYCRAGFARYALPAIVFAELLAALGLSWVWNSTRSVPLRSTAMLLLTSIVAFQAFHCIDALHQFRDDSRDRVRAWLEQNMKPTEYAAAEGFAGFSSWHGGIGFGQPGINGRITSAMFAPQFGSFPIMRFRGFTYVVVCELAYTRYVDDWRIASPGDEFRFSEFKAWYQQLFAHGNLVWHYVPERNLLAYTNPEIRVYRITK